MRIIAQNGKCDMKYEEGALKVEGPRIYAFVPGEKLCLGIYATNHDDPKKVLEMVRNAFVNGKEVFQMPKSSEIV